jgi:hypothetical protein
LGFKLQYLCEIADFFLIFFRTWLWGFWAPPSVFFWLIRVRRNVGFLEVLKLVLQPRVVPPHEDAGAVPDFSFRLRLTYLLQGFLLFLSHVFYPDRADPPLLVLL